MRLKTTREPNAISLMGGFRWAQPGSEARIRAAMAELTEAIIAFVKPPPTGALPAVMARSVFEVADLDLEKPADRKKAARFVGGPPSTALDHIGKGSAIVLTAIAQGASDRAELAVLTGYKSRSITTYLGDLRRRGFIDGFTATSAGIASLGPNFQKLPTGDALRTYWLEKLGPGEQMVLANIVRVYPHPASRILLMQATGYKARSVTTYVGALMRRKLVTRIDGGYRASDTLFSNPRAA